ncbi:hypothetical protein ACJJIF_04375 [Microbulbifer sp. SSSA002]|uniref:hypothetical protein n=1 Tax=unclassified Microbulbifer TaxID=2619833 RepID=UPI004039F2E4
MDLKTTIYPYNHRKIIDSWRLTISLALAIGVHAVLVAIPVSLTPDVGPSPSATHRFKLFAGKNIQAPAAANTDKDKTRPPPSSGKQGQSVRDTVTTMVKDEPISTPPPQETKRTSAPSTVNHRVIDTPVAPGAEHQPTVFDSVLAKKLARERNKIRRFEPVEARYKTATGTFTQIGDRCFDVKETSAGSTDSDLNSWFRAKCPNNSRSQADIDRLAEKYGIS